MQKQRLELLKKMEEILKKAEYQGKANDYHQRADIKSYHYFSQELDNLPLLRIVIKELADKKIFYDHLFEIKDDQQNG